MTTKTDQRRRRRAGFEVISPTVFKPKLVAWLIWEGFLSEDNLVGTAGEVRDRITRALETYLASHYNLVALTDSPDEPQGRAEDCYQFLDLRHRSKAELITSIGALDLEKQAWDQGCRWAFGTFLITARTAALRKIADNIPEPDGYLDTPGSLTENNGVEFDEATWVPDDLRDRLEPHYVANDYDTEENVEEASFDLSDAALEGEYAEEDAD
jgi:hypothetical protein